MRGSEQGYGARGEGGVEMVKNPTITVRLDNELKDAAEEIGEGNRSRGVKLALEFYLEHNTDDYKQDNKEYVVGKMLKELSRPVEEYYAEYFLKLFDVWVNGADRWLSVAACERNFNTVNGGNCNVKKILTKLETAGFVERRGKEFRPILRCNNGLSKEQFASLVKNYRDIITENHSKENLTEYIQTKLINEWTI